MRTQQRAGRTLAAILAAAPLALTACGELKLAEGAAAGVFHAVGENTGEIKVTASEVARRYHASESEVAVVASQADRYSGWTDPQSSVERMAAIALAVKRNKAVSAGVDVACKWGQGEITTPAQFQSALTSATTGMLASDAQAFRDASAELATRLKRIKSQGSPKDQAAAALFCWGYSVVPVPDGR